MAVPLGFDRFSEGLRAIAETFHALKKILNGKSLSTGVGDEGGFAPNLGSNEEAMDVIMEAIKKAGYKPGNDISLALDSAASSFSSISNPNTAEMVRGRRDDLSDMVDLAKKWIDEYPISFLGRSPGRNRIGRFCQETDRTGRRQCPHCWR